MLARTIISRALFVLALPFVFLGLIDPLEGGISLVLATLIYLVSFLVIKQKPKKILWIPLVTALALGIVTLAFALARLEFSQGPTSLPGPVIFGLWGYRLAVAVTLVGALLTVVQSFRKAS